MEFMLDDDMVPDLRHKTRVEKQHEEESKCQSYNDSLGKLVEHVVSIEKREDTECEKSCDAV